jgi:hypothetical protein
VDYIFSEFMGYFLLHEYMLQSVLIAKDRFLKERRKDLDALDNFPLVIPYSCHIFLAAYSNLAHTEEMKKHFSAGENQTPYNTCTATLPKEHLLSDGLQMYEVFLNQIKTSDNSFRNTDTLEITAKGQLGGFVGWFDCYMLQGDNVFSTSPKSI